MTPLILYTKLKGAVPVKLTDNVSLSPAQIVVVSDVKIALGAGNIRTNADPETVPVQPLSSVTLTKVILELLKIVIGKRNGSCEILICGVCGVPLMSYTKSNGGVPPEKFTEIRVELPAQMVSFPASDNSADGEVFDTMAIMDVFGPVHPASVTRF